MKAQDLKNSILQLAIQGKLVPQNPNDELAEVLYAKIQAEKQKLIKEGKIKKDKPLPPITDDEIPFEIPSTWKWVRLGEIGESRIGLTYHPEDVSDNGTIVLRSSNIQNSKLDFNNLVRVKTNIPSNLFVNKGDIVICARNGSKALVGKSALIENIKEPMTFGAFMAIYKSCVNEYVKMYLDSPLFKKMLDAVNTVTINQITQKNLNNAIIPLPPLAEQKRIVTKIEELEPLIKQYEQAETKLSTLNDIFPEQLKKSILQYAIQGKLVAQDPNDEPAEDLYAKIQAEKQKLIKEGKIKKDKPLPPITDAEIPFSIPSTWKWVRLGDIINLISGRDLLPNEYFENYNKGSIPYITGASNFRNENILINRYTSNPTVISQKDDLLMTCKGTIGTIAFLSCEKAHIARQVMAMRIYNWFDINYLKYFLLYCVSNFQSKAKSIIPGISRNDVLEFNFPLPPLAEQHRIVSKVNELMQYCEMLINSKK